ncbi:MAG: ribose 5-phosphate isomerase [Actinomycetota bacterium]|nr:ribose 5-phosphate isomerase [Actinomycetota bacterium]
MLPGNSLITTASLVIVAPVAGRAPPSGAVECATRQRAGIAFGRNLTETSRGGPSTAATSEFPPAATWFTGCLWWEIPATLASVRVYLGSDHAGFELKTHLVRHLTEQGHEVQDVGPAEFDPDDSYPPYCIETGRRVIADPGSLGVVVGGSGNGEQMAANKVPGIRAALAWNVEIATLGREHNDAQVVAIGARMHTADEAAAIVTAFVDTPFSHDPRHAHRIAQLTRYEESGEPPALPGS